ncbi:MAG: Verru_Chthon cassette protein D [Verrucomicrobiales bacterium]|jgi:uncharacterized protein (TIGR02596 family)|nr:Verru_Chthon cassette protein D [Verrucomicrobiales bacterium]
MSRQSTRAFSLIELLVVIGIIAMLVGIATPAFMAINRNSQLTQAGQTLIEEFTVARQTALTKNCVIEVRFYAFASANDNVRRYRAVQSFIVDDNGNATAVGKARYLPGPVIMDADGEISTLLDTQNAKTNWSDDDPQIPLPGVGTAYDVRFFQYRPDGSTGLSPIGRQWFVTLHNVNSANNPGQLPNNYYVIQVNPLNGIVQAYRP